MTPFKRQSEQFKGLKQRFLQPKMRPLYSTMGCSEGHDHRICAELASRFEISHYEVFVRAYHWYHGRDFLAIDGDFKAYLLSGCDAVPPYVRQYVREWQPGSLSA